MPLSKHFTAAVDYYTTPAYEWAYRQPAMDRQKDQATLPLTVELFATDRFGKKGTHCVLLYTY